MELLYIYINKIKEIDWAISLLAAIPLSVIANLITPKLSTFLSKRSKNRIHKRIEELEAELQDILELSSNKQKLYEISAIAVFRVLIAIAIGGALSSFGLFSFGVPAIFYLSAFIIAQKHLSLLRRCYEFGDYENKASSQIEELLKKAETASNK